MRGTTFDGMEIHENFIPHDSLCATGESLHTYYPLAAATHDHANRNNNQCTTHQSGTQQHDVDSTKPKYDDSIRIIVEEPDGFKKVCRVQRITYKNFLTMCEEITKLEHKTTAQLLTPMLTKPTFCTPATSPQQAPQQSFKNAQPHSISPSVIPTTQRPPPPPQVVTEPKQEPGVTLDSVFPNGQNASYSSLQPPFVNANMNMLSGLTPSPNQFFPTSNLPNQLQNTNTMSNQHNNAAAVSMSPSLWGDFSNWKNQAPAALFDDPKMRSRLFDDAKLSQIVRKFCDTKELIVDQTSNKGNILVLKNHGYSLKPVTPGRNVKKSDGVWRCAICPIFFERSVNFTVKDNLKKHYYEHFEFNRVTCLVCNWKHARTDRVKDHVKSVHRILKPTFQVHYKDSFEDGMVESLKFLRLWHRKDKRNTINALSSYERNDDAEMQLAITPQ